MFIKTKNENVMWNSNFYINVDGDEVDLDIDTMNVKEGNVS